jgi:sugar diacid utilization regulator
MPSVSGDDVRRQPAASERAAQAAGQVAGGREDTPDLDELLHVIARKVCELLGVARASVYLRDERGDFRGQVGHGEANIDTRVKRLVAGVAGDRFTRAILASKQPVVISNVPNDPRPLRATMREWGVMSMLGIPMVLHDEVIGILFLDDGENAHVFSASAREIGCAFAELAAVAVAQAQGAARLRGSVETVIRQSHSLRRAAALDDRLNELSAEGASVRRVVEVVAELTGRPACFHDARGNRLALAAAGTGEMTPRLLDAAHRDHPAIEDALAKAEGPGAVLVDPVLDAGLVHRHLLASVRTANGLHGHLVIMETGTRLSSLDARLAQRAAQILAIEFATEQRAAAAECDMRASLASDLIRGDRDADALRRRGDFLGVDLERPHVLCLIGGAGSGDRVSGASEGLADALRGLNGGQPVLTTDVATGAAAIVALDPSLAVHAGVAQAKSTIHEALAGIRAESGLLVALSSTVCGPGGYARAAAEAGQVLQCVERLAGEDGPWVLSAEDLGAGRLMLASASAEELERFVGDALGALLDDDESIAALLTTLQVFFECSRSIRGSSVVLDVHENTVRYRLTRIHELTGLDVAANSDDQLTAQIALRVLQLQGRRPWRFVAPQSPRTALVTEQVNRVAAALV